MNRLNIALAACYWVSVIAVLRLTYSLGDYRAGVITFDNLVAAHLQLATGVWILSMCIWWIAKRITGRPLLRAFLAFAILAPLLFAYGLFQFQAPLEVKIPITPGPVRSHFFSDYMPLMFSFISGPICSLLLALVVVIDGERESLSMKSKRV